MSLRITCLHHGLPPVGFIASCLLLLVPAVAGANTSNSLLDVSPDGKQLLAANVDNWTVTVVDTAGARALHEIKVGRRPESVTWIGAGPLAAVTCYWDGEVMLLDTTAGKVVATIKVDPEPYGIVADKAGKRAWVTHEYPGVVSEIDLDTRKVVRKLPAGQFLRGVALDAAEKRLYVTEFYTAKLHAIDLESGKVVDSWKGHSTDNLSRHVLLHPRRPKAYLSHIRSMIKVIDGGGSIFPFVTVFDLKPDQGQGRHSGFSMDTYNGVYVVTNAWEADMTSDGKFFYTIYAGTNDMNISRVIDDDYREIEAVGRAVRVGQNPRAVRVSPDNQKVYVYNTLDFSVDIRQASTLQLVSKVKVCDPPKSPEWVRGKVLFNTANYPMSSRRWVACFSCHPDGHSDGRAWNNPEGLRKTTALFGAAHTHPLHWSGDRDEVQDFEYTIRSPLMRGAGLFRGSILPKKAWEKIELEQKTSGLSKDLDALAIYSNSFEFMILSPHIPAPGQLSPAAQRGKELFVSAEVGCAKCHSGPYFTDSSLKKPYNLHDVGTSVDNPAEKMGPLYDTPTLLGIYRQPLYLHHGKAKSLHEVLTKYNHQDRHGKTSHLTPAQLDDLVAFLRSLPYEAPPTVTENTVPYRFVPGKKE
jgi:YVTN family beta-propeller protein